ncbi:hypothetical protein LPUS_08542 [Lasallia pustulata]|uniref:Uncharacterized protein n=1 Tax=Lasallia pustulata TaxID=136370 RepID=A0A1W5D5J4_9LECA|nr:hypothetical protein LPUS_08542 [Lasallia pustulata]
MGELARTLVALSGPDSVHGIVPRGLLGVERGGDGDAGGSRGRGGKRPGWRARLPSLFASSSSASPSGWEADDGAAADDAAALLREDVYGRAILVGDLPARKLLMMREVAAAGVGSGFVALSGGFWDAG